MGKCNPEKYRDQIRCLRWNVVCPHRYGKFTVTAGSCALFLYAVVSGPFGGRRKDSNTLPASGEDNDNLADMSDVKLFVLLCIYYYRFIKWQGQR